MMGKRSAQDKLFAADHVYLDFVGRDTLYGYLAQNREQLFRDEDFAALYCPDNGRQSVPPSVAVSVSEPGCRTNWRPSWKRPISNYPVWYRIYWA